MTLEDIQTAWQHHVEVEAANDDVGLDCRPVKGGAVATGGMLLPSFLKAFDELARAKYLYSPHGGDDRGSVNRLLLKDVFGNVTTTPNVSAHDDDNAATSRRL